MNTNAELWVQALRGGGYQQGIGRLREPRRFPWQRDAYCATGVLYDLYLRSDGEQWPKQTEGWVPAEALAWAGIPRALEETLAMHNDQGTSFTDIASMIEAHFARLDSGQRYEEAARIAKQAIERARQASRHSVVA